MNYTFLILSNQPFDLDLKTNKWHVATRLAKRGHSVVFVDPPLRFKALKSFLKKPSFNLNRLFFGVEKESSKLIVYKPANLFNFWPFSLCNTWVHSRKIKKLLRLGRSNPLIVYVYHFDFPDLERFLKKLEYDLLIYDVVDEYTAFPEYANRKKINTGIIAWIQWLDDELKIRINQKGLQGKDWVLYREKWLSDKADLVFASAPNLVIKFKKWRKQVAYLPNGVAIEEFDRPKSKFKEPEDIKKIPHPRIGFSGAIDAYKNNIPLVEKCAETYPKYHFIMIGPERLSDPDLDLTKLKGMSNVHFLGVKPWRKVPAYFNYFDVYFIPYNLNDYTMGCHPVKYFEGLAAGLPTIVTDMPAYKAFDVDGYVSKNDNEFIENIKRALEEDSPKRRQKRKELARQNSWDRKVEKQLKLIQRFIS